MRTGLGGARAVATVLVAVVLMWARSASATSPLLAVSETARERERVLEMFNHAFDGYMKHAFPHDELRATSCTGMDTFGQYSLTLIDSLDMLLLVGRTSDFESATRWIGDHLSFDIDLTVSVFETNIRVLGGLLSGYVMWEHTHGSSFDSAPLLAAARALGDRLLPAFATPTGIPYGSINLRSGVAPDESVVTSVAGAGSALLEFGVLSAVTGDTRYWAAARRAWFAVWSARTGAGLVGSHVNIKTGAWVEELAAIGSNVDSFFEYGLKAGLLFDDTELLDAFGAAYAAAKQRLARGPYYFDFFLRTHLFSSPVAIQHLQAFWFGMQTLVGDLDAAAASARAYHAVWRRYGALPERFDINAGGVAETGEGAAYHLRPELVESIYYLSLAAASPDEWLLRASEHVDALNTRMRTQCGFGGLPDVRDDLLTDRMESFLLAETLKYLFLTFDREHPVNRGAFVFTTEGHVLPMLPAFRQLGSHVHGARARDVRSTAICAARQTLLAPARAFAEWVLPLRPEWAGQFFSALTPSERATIFVVDEIGRASLAQANNAPATSNPSLAPATAGSAAAAAMATAAAALSPSPAGADADGAASAAAQAPTPTPTPVPHADASGGIPVSSSSPLLALFADGSEMVFDISSATLAFKYAGKTLALESVNGVAVTHARLFLLSAAAQAPDPETGVRVDVTLDGEVYQSLEAAPATFGKLLAVDERVVGLLAAVEPAHGCTALQSSGGVAPVAGSFVLVDRGECLFIEKALVAQAAGASALIVVNAPAFTDTVVDDNELRLIGGDGNATREALIAIPLAMISQREGRKLRGALARHPSGVQVALVGTKALWEGARADSDALDESTVKMMYDGQVVTNVRVVHPTLQNRLRRGP